MWAVDRQTGTVSDSSRVCRLLPAVRHASAVDPERAWLDEVWPVFVDAEQVKVFELH